ncbi:hypothetical protein [Hyalangium sp.]|uniref:hypothetical protein n=1 Tax=Hyalangium sp. TaxID=2028555 RepID=UPI002D447EC8|nr:hypothetical protein [Hyalangium sp.]HYH95149.1 hypothetical protein [Hyalangium sp.]
MGSKSISKEFPGFDKIFSLGESGYSRAFRGKMAVETDDVGLTRAEVHPVHPIRVDWAMGRAKPADPVMWTTHAVPIIVADSLLQLLRSHGFTGWSRYDVTVRDKQDQLVPSYSGLAVTGRCGNLEHSMSVEVPRIYPAGIFPVWKGLLFDPASWDGSDFFMPAQRFGFVFVVEEVKKAFERAKIRNVRFTALDQFERSWTI